MTRKQRRLTFIAVFGSVLALAVGLVLFALSDSIAFFATPTDLTTTVIEPGQRIRLGGLVEDGSLSREGGETVVFRVTDTNAAVTVTYTGLLPDLFREGQGVVTEGTLSPDGVFLADTVLAKHDENYMPAEVAEALRQQGVWQGDAPPPAPAPSGGY